MQFAPSTFFSAAKFVFQKLKFLLKQEYKFRKTKQSSAFVVALNIFAASSLKRRGRPQLVWPFKVPWNWRQFLKRMQRWRHPDLIPKLLTYFSQIFLPSRVPPKVRGNFFYVIDGVAISSFIAGVLFPIYSRSVTVNAWDRFNQPKRHL